MESLRETFETVTEIEVKDDKTTQREQLVLSPQGLEEFLKDESERSEG